MSAPESTAGSEQLSARLRELIDIPSESRDEAALLQHITQVMPSSYGVTFESDAVALFRPQVSSGPLVLLCGHTDTVPITGNVPATLNSGIITGRGASDMKSGLAVMVELARWIHEKQLTPAAEIGFLFFGREELPLDESALLPAIEQSDELKNADFALLMEPTDNALEVGCQGNLNLTLICHGIAAHSARPWEGRNAAHEGMRRIQPVLPASPEDVDINGLVFREVANVTGVRSGGPRNVLPDRMEIDINIRYAPNRSAADAEAAWVARFAAAADEVVVISNAPPAPVVTEHGVIANLASCGVTTVRPKQAWTNAADFARFGVPAANFGPGDPAFAHKTNEQVRVEALAESLAILKRFVIT